MNGQEKDSYEIKLHIYHILNKDMESDETGFGTTERHEECCFSRCERLEQVSFAWKATNLTCYW